MDANPIDAVPLPPVRDARGRRWRLLLATGPLVMLLLSIALLASDSEPLAMDDRARRQLPGRFVALSDGDTNDEVVGPERGPVVLLVSGISIPRGVFVRTLAPLAEASYRVVTFDLYGRVLVRCGGLMPSARYVEIPAGHLPQYERPDLTNAASLQFLGET